MLSLLCIFTVVVVDYTRIILIVMASAFFHTHPSLSLMLYILSISLDGKYPVFDYKFVFYFMY